MTGAASVVTMMVVVVTAVAAESKLNQPIITFHDASKTCGAGMGYPILFAAVTLSVC